MALGIYDEEDIRALAEEIRFCKGGGGHMTVKEMREEIPNVKEFGFSEGWSDGYNSGLTKGNEQGLEEGKSIGYDEGKTNGIEEGKKSQYDAFWDAYQDNGSYHNYLYAFAGPGWNDENYNPKYTIRLNQNGQNIFSYSNITDTKVDIDYSKLTFNTGYGFMNATKLKTIRKIITGNNKYMAWNTLFTECISLENLIIEGEILTSYTVNFQWSTKLTHESLISIINALEDNSGTNTWNTITLGADNIAKLTPEELEIMDLKQWNYN